MIKYFVINKNELTKEMISLSTKTFETTPLFYDFYIIATNKFLDVAYREYRPLSIEELRIVKQKIENNSITDLNHKIISAETSPFKSKFYKGYKIYGHVFGAKKNFTANEVGTLRIKVPFDVCFFTEAELINAPVGTIVDFKFQVDDGNGGYIDIFHHGHSVNVRPDFYKRKSAYEAELNSSIYVCAVLANGNEDREIGFNINLHEAR